MRPRTRHTRTVCREALWLAFFVAIGAVAIWCAVYAAVCLFAGGW